MGWADVQNINKCEGRAAAEDSEAIGAGNGGNQGVINGKYRYRREAEISYSMKIGIAGSSAGRKCISKYLFYEMKEAG